MPKAKTKKTSPTQRSLDFLRGHGYQAAIVEKRVPGRFDITIDLFGCIDILAVGEGIKGIWGIQTTTGDNMAKRATKARQEPRLRAFLASGNRFFVHGWRKLAKTRTWTVREEEVTLADLTEKTDETC